MPVSLGIQNSREQPTTYQPLVIDQLNNIIS